MIRLTIGIPHFSSARSLTTKEQSLFISFHNATARDII
jgi:hypothetical protein